MLGGLRTTSPCVICTIVTRGRVNGNLCARKNLLLWGILGRGEGVRLVLATFPRNGHLLARESVPQRPSLQGHRRCWQLGRAACLLLQTWEPREGVMGDAGKAGGWAGSGPTQHPALPAQPRAGSLQDQALCCWLPPSPPREGCQGALGTGRSRIGEACCVHGAAAGPGLASHPLHPAL